MFQYYVVFASSSVGCWMLLLNGCFLFHSSFLFLFFSCFISLLVCRQMLLFKIINCICCKGLRVEIVSHQMNLFHFFFICFIFLLVFLCLFLFKFLFSLLFGCLTHTWFHNFAFTLLLILIVFFFLFLINIFLSLLLVSNPKMLCALNLLDFYSCFFFFFKMFCIWIFFYFRNSNQMFFFAYKCFCSENVWLNNSFFILLVFLVVCVSLLLVHLSKMFFLCF